MALPKETIDYKRKICFIGSKSIFHKCYFEIQRKIGFVIVQILSFK
jgi:hypothetical protein